MSDTVIETARLRLRLPRPGDEDAFDHHCNTPAVMRHLGGVQSRADNNAALVRVRACQAEHGHCFWMVERKADGAFLGFCGLKRVNAEGAPTPGDFEIGWRFREDAWGQGYAKEAAAASLDRAFGVLGASHVVALTIEENVGSWGLMERLGMTRRPDLDFFDPKYGPTIVYRIDAADWKGL